MTRIVLLTCIVLGACFEVKHQPSNDFLAAEVKRLEQDPPSGLGVGKTTHKNWFERMGDSFMSVIAGIIIIFFSFPVMWINERRAARYESLIAVGAKECQENGPNEADASRRGGLIHLSGAEAQGKSAIADGRFRELRFESGCLRLRSTVWVYQWVQHEHTEERKDNIGGGTTKVTTYTYTKDWCTHPVNSDHFDDRSRHNIVSVPSLECGEQTVTCDLVHYGNAFEVTLELVCQLTSWQDASSIVGNNVREFTREADYFYSPKCREPMIGDMRAQLEYIPDTVATIMALQVEGREGRDSFLPYRMISRGWCCFGITHEEQKARQIVEGRKTPDDLYAQDKCSCGVLNSICCCCLCAVNLVTFCFSALAPPEVCHMWQGTVPMASCWQMIKKAASSQMWIIRLVGWLMLLVGLMMTLQPIFVVIDLIPFLGPYIGKFLWVAVVFVAGFTTLGVATFVISCAYLLYRPLIGMLFSAAAALVIAVPILIAHSTKS